MAKAYKKYVRPPTADTFSSAILFPDQAVIRPSGDYLAAGDSYSGVSGNKSADRQAPSSRDFWIVKLSTDPLPVTLAEFSAKQEGNTALLQWETTSESAPSEFEILHSLDGRQWRRIGSIAAAGESNSDRNYYFTNHEPADGVNNLYRLKMIDIDGSFALSSIKSLFFGQRSAGRIYPNPAPAGELTVDVGNWESVKNVQISTTNALTVYDSGNNPQQTIDINSLPSGIYILKVSKKDGSSELFRFIR